jgi:hypothetical protein
MGYPPAVDTAKVGSYPASAKAGGGYVWDAVLEYRVWCYPAEGAEDLDDGSDYYYAFSRPKRNERTIPDFFSPRAPPNRLDIIRGKDTGT